MGLYNNINKNRKKLVKSFLVISAFSLTMLAPFASFAKTDTAQSASSKGAASQNAELYRGKKDAIAIDFYPKYPKIIIKPGMNKKLIERGEYLVKMGDCIACHTDTDHHGKPFAGGLTIDTPFGAFFTPNITPDKKTGIGGWSTEQFIRAMHDGVNPKGQYYFPVFPYPSFTNVSKQDLIAIKAYLDALPPINKADKKPTAPWPFSWRFSQLFWRTLYFKAGYYQYDPKHSAQWNRGAYIVKGLGHCSACHTPRNIMGAKKNKYYLTGAFVDGFWAPDITSRGLQDASDQMVMKVFEDDELIQKAGPVARPMAEVNHDSLQYLSKKDLEAVIVYLKSVKSVQPRVPKISPEEQKNIVPITKAGMKFNPTTLKVGEKVYVKVCAICHDSGMAGAPKIYDTQNWTRRLDAAQEGIETFYDRAIKGYNQMPTKGGCVTCTDNEIKAAVDYILANSSDPMGEAQAKGAKYIPPNTSIALGKQVYEKTCSVCHDEGKLGAPKLGDGPVWAPILKKNIDVLILNVIHGRNHIAVNKMCKGCKTSDVIAAVKYMVQKSDTKGNYKLW